MTRRIVVHLNADGVNGDVEIYGDTDGIEVVVCTGPDGEVIGANVAPEEVPMEIVEPRF